MFLPKGEYVRLARKKMIKSKNGRDLCFVKVVDMCHNFENIEFMLDMESCSPESLEEGKDYDLIISLEDKYVNAVLLPLATK